jgi:hypothetical protein
MDDRLAVFAASPTWQLLPHRPNCDFQSLYCPHIPDCWTLTKFWEILGQV